jgi:peptide/nickel transport system substrate-binding protein
VPPDGANRGRYHNEHVDRLLEKARTTQNLEQQAAIYRIIQQVLYETLPYVPLWFEDHVFVARDDIKGYRISTDGNYDGLVNVYKITQRRYN